MSKQFFFCLFLKKRKRRIKKEQSKKRGSFTTKKTPNNINKEKTKSSLKPLFKYKFNAKKEEQVSINNFPLYIHRQTTHSLFLLISQDYFQHLKN